MHEILDNTKAWIPGAAGIVLVWASVHEWLYRQHHHYAPGPSGILALAFLAGAAVAFSVMFVAKDLAAHKTFSWVHLTVDEHRRLAAMYEAWSEEHGVMEP